MKTILVLAAFAAACAATPVREAPKRKEVVSTRTLPPAPVDPPRPRPICELEEKTPEPPELPPSESVEGVSDSNLQRWVYALADERLRGRRAGTEDARVAAKMIATRFAELGLEAPSGQGYCERFEAGEIRDQNVIATLPPADPACKSVIVGAHYDGLGADRKGGIRPGADDNATGVSVLLELARIFSASESGRRVGLVFAAFGAEEAGLVGSRAWVERPSVDLERVRLMINVDMAGRTLRGNPGLGFEATGPDRRSTAALVRRASEETKVPVISMRLGDRGDSASFSPHLPTVFFSTTVHADYHQVTDTAERVDYGQVARAHRLVAELIRSLDCNGA